MSTFRSAPVAWAIAGILLVAGGVFNAVMWIDRDELLGRLEASRVRLDKAYRRIENLEAGTEGLRAENRTLSDETQELSGEVLECVDALRASIRLYNGLVDELNAIGALDPAQAEAFADEVDALRAEANDALRACQRVTS